MRNLQRENKLRSREKTEEWAGYFAMNTSAAKTFVFVGEMKGRPSPQE